MNLNIMSEYIGYMRLIVKSLNIPGLPTPLASCPLVQSNNYGSSLLLQNITILASYWQI